MWFFSITRTFAHLNTRIPWIIVSQTFDNNLTANNKEPAIEKCYVIMFIIYIVYTNNNYTQTIDCNSKV